MNEGTRFWIVRPRVGFGGVSGLGTLLSGAYVEFDPGEGQPAHDFVGLEEPPPISSRGARDPVRSAHRPARGGIGRGAPVYYRGIRVGQVLGYDLAEDRQSLIVKVFVDAPNDQLVRPSSRFWNASGVDVSLGTDGVDVSIESLEALLAGGIAFDTPDIDQPGERGRCRYGLPAVRQFARRDRGGLHRAHPLSGPLRRLGARPARRGAGRVPRHSGRYRDRRPARDRPSAGYRAHSGDPRDRAATDRRRARCRRGALCRHGRLGRTRAAGAAASPATC